jgi:hypothetical protein
MGLGHRDGPESDRHGPAIARWSFERLPHAMHGGTSNTKRKERALMSSNLVDVLVHIDQSLTHDRVAALKRVIAGLNGVASAEGNDDKPHLVMIRYDPAKVTSQEILALVKAQGVGAELIGL